MTIVYFCSNSDLGMISGIWELNQGRLLGGVALGIKPGENLGEGGWWKGGTAWAKAQKLDRARFASVGTVILFFIPTDSGLKPRDTRPHHSLPAA